jgi:UPF0755 protein
VKRAAIVCIVVGIAGAALAAGWLYRGLQPMQPDSETTLIFRVERGRGFSQIARSLEAAGVIPNARALVLVAKLKGLESRIQAGEYGFSPAQAPEEILRQLISGRVRTYTAVLPEGIRATEIAARLEAAGLANATEFLAVAFDREFVASLGIEANSLEGYLYPETYELPRDLPPRALAEILVRQFDAVWKEIEPESQHQLLSRHEIVTLASIVEKETAAPEERPIIAAVFVNRLKRRMRLETDPSVIYGIDNFDGNLRKRDLRNKDNPYNTYQIAGLPPGPIASPGADALRAVLKPADSDYLYFVSRNDGTHHFSRTYREHVNAVNRFQKRPKRRRSVR